MKNSTESVISLIASLAITGEVIYGIFWVASKGWNKGKN
jgi:hypothetical protein